jgi:hypothetical protein
MAKISGFKRIIKEDFSEENQEIADKVGYSVNSFADEIIKALNGNLNEDNLVDKSKSLTVTVDGSGTPKEKLIFKTGLIKKAEGLLVIRAENLTNPNVYPTSAPFLSFSENNGLITVNNITGLQADYKYRLKIKIIG